MGNTLGTLLVTGGVFPSLRDPDNVSSVEEFTFLHDKPLFFKALQRKDLLWNSGIDFFSSSEFPGTALDLNCVKTSVASWRIMLSSAPLDMMAYQASVTCKERLSVCLGRWSAVQNCFAIYWNPTLQEYELWYRHVEATQNIKYTEINFYHRQMEALKNIRYTEINIYSWMQLFYSVSSLVHSVDGGGGALIVKHPLYTHVHIYVCTRIHIYIHIHMYTHMYTHVCIHALTHGYIHSFSSAVDL